MKYVELYLVADYSEVTSPENAHSAVSYFAEMWTHSSFCASLSYKFDLKSGQGHF